jgi:GxxExxY protein
MKESDPESYAVIGAAIEVFNELGHGFHEVVYHAALRKELALRRIPSESEKELPVHFKGEVIGVYRADFVCFGALLVEIKALSETGNREKAQVLNYLKASKLEKALLINFGAKSLEYKRIVLTHP